MVGQEPRFADGFFGIWEEGGEGGFAPDFFAEGRGWGDGLGHWGISLAGVRVGLDSRGSTERRLQAGLPDPTWQVSLLLARFASGGGGPIANRPQVANLPPKKKGASKNKADK